ncbi:DeoR family transcriptional regulator [Tetragenococcus halophilus subsp. flandriensis]|uniref:DeoR/GlpR family DNA-binding transcription regulator n=1 Tax=Tetragenococcus halophilus TaxID=51669 RepID=UPI0023E9140C|nr:DeoR/GlpR family DNA-binding transcription regulator [Tetragenococcus halophilus]GMA09356.1 DeoR family transcriptional regulator [Tetragenococcus halophilus subsp. flandriensis]
MFTEERHKKIIDIVNEEKSVSVKELTERLAFSPATIRSDLNLLNNQGLLIRTHGGATSIEENTNNKSLNINFGLREQEHPTEKIEIAKKAIEFVKENSCIILDASSTSFELGKLINETNMRLMILTNGLNVANILKNNTNITTILIGGVVQGNSNAIQGTLGDNLLQKLNVDTAFVSAHAFNLKEGLTDFNLYEVALKQLMVQYAKTVYALIDHSKLEKSSIATFGTLDDINYFITDSKVDPEIIKKYKNEELIVL